MILITGHRGLIASHVIEELKKYNIEYKIFIGDCERLEDWRQNLINHEFTHLIHCASKNGGITFSSKYPADIFAANTIMSINALNSCYIYKIPYFLSFVTSCGYDSNNQSIRYGEWDYFQGAPHESIEAHGYSKRNLLLAAKFYNQQYDIKSLILCPNTTFGPGEQCDERSKVLMSLIKKFVHAKLTNRPSVTILGTGTPLREFTYVKHVSQIVVKCIQNPLMFSSGWQLINIGPSTEMSISDLAYTISTILNYKGDILFDISSPDGASRKALNYARQESKGLVPDKIYSFDEALKETIKWYVGYIGEDYDKLIT